jgi:hypothetical protein
MQSYGFLCVGPETFVHWLRYGLEDRGIEVRFLEGESNFLSSAPRADLRPSGGKETRTCSQNVASIPVQRLTLCGAVPSLPHISESESYITADCQSVSRVRGFRPDVFSLSESCGFVYVGRSLWREDGSVVYNCSWSSPAQSFSAATKFYCLLFDTFICVAS